MADADLADLAAAAVEGGAGLLEIGIPFSDPLADGPTVQRAGQRALAGRDDDAGGRSSSCARCGRGWRVPLVPMTYASPVMAYGERRFCADAAAAGRGRPDRPRRPRRRGRTSSRPAARARPRPGAAARADVRRCADRAGLRPAGGFVYLVSVAGTRAPARSAPTASPA